MHVGAVSRESTRIAFARDALNRLQGFVANIKNYWLQAPSYKKKHHVMCSTKFRLVNVGKIELIRRDDHGSKSYGK